MIVRKSSLIFLTFLSYTFSGCVFGKLTFSDGKDWVPKDFHPKTEILLIQEFPTDENIKKNMIDYLKKNYRGQYEVVNKEMIIGKNIKYEDTELYRFGFLWDFKSNNGINKNENTKPIGYFYDRSNNKRYPSTKKKNGYQLKNAYMSYINTIDLFYKK